jgi:hypothetical protein
MSDVDPTLTYQDQAHALLLAAASCLSTKSPNGCPSEVFHSHGDPYYMGCDYLAVFVGPITPYRLFPAQPLVDVAESCDAIEWALPLTLKLRRCDYPHLTGSDGYPKLPATADLTSATIRQNIDARVLTCCLPGLWQSGALFFNADIPETDGDLLGRKLPVVWGQVSPSREANVAGWDWPITVGTPGCCSLPDIDSGSGSGV